MTSISSAASGRHVGSATVSDSGSSPDTVKPIGSSSCGDVVALQLGAEDAVHLAHPDPARPSLRPQRLGPGVDASGVDDEVGTRLGEQLGEAGDREIDRVRVDVAFESASRRRCAGRCG